MGKFIVPIETVVKIVSGGQTGVDRGALEAARAAGFPYGGMVPKGRLAEDGAVPAKFTDMIEAGSESYRFRTRWNVEHADATLILTFSEKLEGGTQRTRQYCMNARKPYFVDNPLEPKMEGGRIGVFAWLEALCRQNNRRPLVLNVAGPRESKAVGICSAAEKYVTRIIAAQRRARKELKEKEPCIVRADFPQWFLERLKEDGVDLAERLSAKLSGVDEVAIERQTDSLFLIWNVTLESSAVVYHKLYQLVWDLGWDAEPSTAVGLVRIWGIAGMLPKLIDDAAEMRRAVEPTLERGSAVLLCRLWAYAVETNRLGDLANALLGFDASHRTMEDNENCDWFWRCRLPEGTNEFYFDLMTFAQARAHLERGAFDDWNDNSLAVLEAMEAYKRYEVGKVIVGIDDVLRKLREKYEFEVELANLSGPSFVAATDGTEAVPPGETSTTSRCHI